MPILRSVRSKEGKKKKKKEEEEERKEKRRREFPMDQRPEGPKVCTLTLIALHLSSGPV